MIIVGDMVVLKSRIKKATPMVVTEVEEIKSRIFITCARQLKLAIHSNVFDVKCLELYKGN